MPFSCIFMIDPPLKDAAKTPDALAASEATIESAADPSLYLLKVHRLKAMGSGDTNTLSRLKPTFAAAQTAAFRRRSFGGSGPFGTS